MAEIIIAKHRNGAVGDVLLKFRGEYARFQDPDEDAYIPMPGESPVYGSKMNDNAVPPPPVHMETSSYSDVPLPDNSVPF